jgi:hypothetical protein
VVVNHDLQFVAVCGRPYSRIVDCRGRRMKWNFSSGRIKEILGTQDHMTWALPCEFLQGLGWALTPPPGPLHFSPLAQRGVSSGQISVTFAIYVRDRNVFVSLALREHAKRWLLAASGMMDSHLHAVSGVSSRSQRSQVESKQYRDASQTKKGISDRKTIRRVSICLVSRPEADSINQ